MAAEHVTELLREIEQHHVNLNRLKGRAESRSTTLRLVREAIAALSAGGEVDGRKPIAWEVQSKAYGKCYSFSNEFLATFPNAPVDYVPAPTPAGAGDAVDAARYRWFRSHAQGEAWNEHDYALVGIEIHKQRGTCKFDMTPEIIDEAIDAAIDACRKGEGL